MGLGAWSKRARGGVGRAGSRLGAGTRRGWGRGERRDGALPSGTPGKGLVGLRGSYRGAGGTSGSPRSPQRGWGGSRDPPRAGLEEGCRPPREGLVGHWGPQKVQDPLRGVGGVWGCWEEAGTAGRGVRLEARALEMWLGGAPSTPKVGLDGIRPLSCGEESLRPCRGRTWLGRGAAWAGAKRRRKGDIRSSGIANGCVEGAEVKAPPSCM